MSVRNTRALSSGRKKISLNKVVKKDIMCFYAQGHIRLPAMDGIEKRAWRQTAIRAKNHEFATPLWYTPSKKDKNSMCGRGWEITPLGRGRREIDIDE